MSLLLKDINKVPQKYLKYILFFPEDWAPPRDFFNLTTPERLKLKDKLSPDSLPYSNYSQWVWFGNYEGKTQFKLVPRLAREYVRKELYNVLIANDADIPSLNRRLIRPVKLELDNKGNEHLVKMNKWDVNPYKLVLGTQYPFIELGRGGVARAHKLTQAQLAAQVYSCIKDIETNYTAGFMDSRAVFKTAMLELGYSALVVEGAIEHADKHLLIFFTDSIYHKGE